MLQKKSRFGFTLLELLVVISIIGILIAMGVAAFSTAQKKGRDAKRRADMKTLQNAFEQYNSVNGGYEAYGTMIIDQTILPAGAPVDPKGGTYVYSGVVAADFTSYCVCAQLEGGGGNSTVAAPNTGVCSFIPVASTNGYYCLGNLQ